VEVDRPGPGEELNLGEETTPRKAASVILLRDGAGGLEVLLVQRNPGARFMGGAWVFPGGSVHDDDGGPEGAGLRELQEEAGVMLEGPDALVPFSRWITPAEVKIRFDTWFYVARAPDGIEPLCDGEECVDLRWLTPLGALEAYQRDELLLVFPTIKHLEQLAELRSVADALETARGREVRPVLPKVAVEDGSAKVLLPGEAGYEEA
jgi:8-oxo-dGTP pyrophosphatase MutT (NUDIX family)